jgi:hypothetical protein
MTEENNPKSDSEPEFLADWQREIVFYIERYHSTVGDIPSDSDILEYMRLTKKYTLRSEDVESLKTNELFLKSMASRGLVINTGPGELRLVTGLTSRQMEAIATIQNYIDRRSDEKKLRDLGISTDEWSTWMQDNSFVNYLNQRSELLIRNAISESHMGLLRGVRQGNLASIKYYNEMTGVYNPNDENQFNISVLMGKILEAVQRQIQDPVLLNRLAIELSSIAMESGAFPVGSAEGANNRRVPISSTRPKEFEV